MKISYQCCFFDCISKFYIVEIDRILFRCYECEAICLCKESIEFAAFLDFSVYLEMKGDLISGSTYETFVDDPDWPGI